MFTLNLRYLLARIAFLEVDGVCRSHHTRGQYLDELVKLLGITTMQEESSP